MLPEEQELKRLETEQSELEEHVASAELFLETNKTEIAQFQYRYYQTVGVLYAKLDELDAVIARLEAGQTPNDIELQAQAEAAEKQARSSAEEAGLAEAQEPPPAEITPEIRLAYKTAAKLLHPDRASNEEERLRRTELMAQVNVAYERGDQKAIEKIMVEYGQDPEAITGGDIASQIIKAIRRIAQLKRRKDEIDQERQTQESLEIYQLKITIEETESMGGDPLGDLAKQLLQEISERQINIEMFNNQGSLL